MIRTFRPAAILLASTALAVGLCGCKPDHRAAPVASAGTPPLGPLDPGYAPAAYGAAAPAPPAQAYAYPQRAYRMSRVVHQRPPSYAFGYGDEQPWVWDDGDQGTMFAEPIDDGYRYYYYEPGEAYPYFVQDPDYGYAYGPDGALIALFAATGALIAADHWRDHAPYAQGYWTRGYDLDRAYRHSTRFPVQPAIWREHAPGVYSGHDRWFRAAQVQPGWREAQPWARQPRHDNGLHLGWFKDRGRGREHAFVGPPAQRVQPQPVRIETGQSRSDHGWRQARQERPAQPAGAPYGHGPVARPEPGAQGWREAHGGGQPQSRPQHGPPVGGGDVGGGDHGGWKHGGGDRGGQAFVRAAEPRGGGASWRGGGGPHGGGGQGDGNGGGQAFARAAGAQGGNAAWRGGGGEGAHGGGRGPGGGNPDGGGGGGNHGGGGGGKGGGHGHDR